MNKHCRIALILCSLCFLFACDKDDTPQPNPGLSTSSLEEIIAGNYWSEKIHFMSYVPGKMNPEIKEYPEDIIKFYQLDGGYSYPEQTTLDKIYVEKDTRKVRRYMSDEYGVYLEYYQNSYTIEYDEGYQSIRIRSPFDSLAYMNAIAGSEMQVVTILEDEIVFDAPIKPFIRETWGLDWFFRDECFLGIRIHWTKENPDRFKSAKPLD